MCRLKMIREIKFRGQRVDTKEWVYGYYVREGTEYFSEPAHYIEKRGKKIRVIPSSIGQYTGFKDKNGIEIYEGDIIIETYYRDYQCTKIHRHNKCVIGDYEKLCEYPVMAMYFNETHSLGQVDDNDYYIAADLKIIGNVHKTPELINNDKDNTSNS